MSNHVDLGFECLSATKPALIFVSVIFFARLCYHTLLLYKRILGQSFISVCQSELEHKST